MSRRTWWVVFGAVLSAVLVAAWWLVPTQIWGGLGEWAGHHDAGDWIAVGALVVAVAGWWQSRVSARAARDSARAAEHTLPLAEKSAEAAVVSARAADRSADIAEAVRHREDAPEWEITFDIVEVGLCVVAAKIVSAPAAIDVFVSYSGWIWGQVRPDAKLIPSKTLVGRLEQPAEGQNKGDRITFPLVVPESIGEPSSVTLTVTLSSVDSRRAESHPESPRWDHAETVRWKADPGTMVMWGD